MRALPSPTQQGATSRADQPFRSTLEGETKTGMAEEQREAAGTDRETGKETHLRVDC